MKKRSITAVRHIILDEHRAKSAAHVFSRRTSMHGVGCFLRSWLVGLSGVCAAISIRAASTICAGSWYARAMRSEGDVASCSLGSSTDVSEQVRIRAKVMMRRRLMYCMASEPERPLIRTAYPSWARERRLSGGVVIRQPTSSVELLLSSSATLLDGTADNNALWTTYFTPKYPIR